MLQNFIFPTLEIMDPDMTSGYGPERKYIRRGGNILRFGNRGLGVGYFILTIHIIIHYPFISSRGE